MTSAPGTAPTDGPPEGLSETDLTGAAVTGAKWVAGSRLIAEVVAFLTSIALARLLAPEDFGRAVVVLILPTLASILTYEGVGAPLVQRRNVTGAAIGTAWVLALASGAVLSAAVFFLGAPLGDWLFGEGTARLCRIVAPVFVLGSGCAVPRALLQRSLDWRALNISEVLALAVVSASSIVLAALGMGAESMVWAAVAGAGATTVYLVRAAGFQKLSWNTQEAKGIASFGAAASVAGLTMTLRRNIDYLVLGVRLDPTVVGYYWRAFQLAVEYQGKISGIASRVAWPVMARAESTSDFGKLRSRIVSFNAVLVFPLLALLAVGAPTLVPALFGEGWDRAIAPTQILAVAGAFGLMLAGLEAPVMAAGHPRALALFNILSMSLTGVAALVMAPHGITAVAASMVIVQFALMLVGLYALLERLVGIPLRQALVDVVPATVASLILAACVWPVQHWGSGALPDAVLLCVMGAVGGVVYPATMRTLFPTTAADVGRLLKRMRRSKSET